MKQLQETHISTVSAMFCSRRDESVSRGRCQTDPRGHKINKPGIWQMLHLVPQRGSQGVASQQLKSIQVSTLQPHPRSCVSTGTHLILLRNYSGKKVQPRKKIAFASVASCTALVPLKGKGRTIQHRKDTQRRSRANCIQLQPPCNHVCSEISPWLFAANRNISQHLQLSAVVSFTPAQHSCRQGLNRSINQWFNRHASDKRSKQEAGKEGKKG